jgi:hypothetical protein
MPAGRRPQVALVEIRLEIADRANDRVPLEGLATLFASTVPASTSRSGWMLDGVADIGPMIGDVGPYGEHLKQSSAGRGWSDVSWRSCKLRSCQLDMPRQ